MATTGGNRIGMAVVALTAALCSAQIARAQGQSGLEGRLAFSPTGGRVTVLAEPDGATDQRIGQAPAAADFSLSLRRETSRIDYCGPYL